MPGPVVQGQTAQLGVGQGVVPGLQKHELFLRHVQTVLELRGLERHLLLCGQQVLGPLVFGLELVGLLALLQKLLGQRFVFRTQLLQLLQRMGKRKLKLLHLCLLALRAALPDGLRALLGRLLPSLRRWNAACLICERLFSSAHFFSPN